VGFFATSRLDHISDPGRSRFPGKNGSNSAALRPPVMILKFTRYVGITGPVMPLFPPVPAKTRKVALPARKNG
jgi:hypothetical protein